jgi:hypothetical protein
MTIMMQWLFMQLNGIEVLLCDERAATVVPSFACST